jgi:uncharacterized membrane protein
VEVKPAIGAEAGEYPINVRVSSADAKAEGPLMVILTGTYGLEIGTATGLLSLEARQGKPANVSFYAKNTGSAANHAIKFMSFKPENSSAWGWIGIGIIVIVIGGLFGLFRWLGRR